MWEKVVGSVVSPLTDISVSECKTRHQAVLLCRGMKGSHLESLYHTRPVPPEYVLSALSLLAQGQGHGVWQETPEQKHGSAGLLSLPLLPFPLPHTSLHVNFLCNRGLYT